MIAIMVMFILAVIAAVFIALVARNLFRAERYSNVDAVAQIAEAGIQYADEMLTSSEEGADWRPIPENRGVSNTPIWSADPAMVVPPVPDTTANPATGQPQWQYERDNNPDFEWTRAWWPTEMGCAGPSGGYTTFDTGRGRFLLRVSYRPNPTDALSKFIKIESVGRWGVFDNNDPTTWKSAGNYRLRREITAYKPIGITDYARFVTNKYSRSMDFSLDCPGFTTTYGRSVESKYGSRGGPIRINGNLMWYGGVPDGPGVRLYMRGVHPIDSAGNANADVVVPIDRMEVAGEIKHVAPSQNVELNRIIIEGTSRTEDGPFGLVPSLPVDQFNTYGGFCRDGRDETDVAKMPRGVKRIEPPLVDQLDLTGTRGRYLLLTLFSGQTMGQGRNRVDLGRLGWGRGIYIENKNDKQDESETLFGGYTLRFDWLKPNNPASTYWVGPYYVPKGVIIMLHPGDTDGDGQPDLTITRTDFGVSGGRYGVWNDAWGNPRPDWGRTVTMPYPDPKNGRDAHQYDSSGNVTATKHLEGNGVIYAEGNIRIRGMLPHGMQLTVVSNESIYIEGNLLKFRDPSKPKPADDDPWRGADNTCGLALLARENICVNTTQFFSPVSSISADDVGSDAMNGRPPFHVVVTPNPDSQLRCLFDFGPWESESGADPGAWWLSVRHAGEYGPSYMNAWLNPSSAFPDFGILFLNDRTPALPKHVWGVGDPAFQAPGWGIGSAFACDVFPLNAATNANFTGGMTPTIPAGMPNLIQFGGDAWYARNNYLMGGMAIQPMDIRIEAVLYAQEGSFFVLPGNWFNPNPNDVPGRPRPDGVAPMFPYFGQALDIRIIIDGAVSENVPAAVGDVDEWMAKWGRIPAAYGSSKTPTAHPGEGLTILYDDHAGWPLSDLGSGTPAKPIRMDAYGRPLPFAPKLPVCRKLLYVGDVM